MIKDEHHEYKYDIKELIRSIQLNVDTLKIASMTQRSLVMDIYTYYCKTLFYFAFMHCNKDLIKGITGSNKDVLLNLKTIHWDAITSIDNTQSYPQTFTAKIYIKDTESVMPISQLKHNDRYIL